MAHTKDCPELAPLSAMLADRFDGQQLQEKLRCVVSDFSGADGVQRSQESIISFVDAVMEKRLPLCDALLMDDMEAYALDGLLESDVSSQDNDLCAMATICCASIICSHVNYSTASDGELLWLMLLLINGISRFDMSGTMCGAVADYLGRIQGKSQSRDEYCIRPSLCIVKLMQAWLAVRDTLVGVSADAVVASWTAPEMRWNGVRSQFVESISLVGARVSADIERLTGLVRDSGGSNQT